MRFIDITRISVRMLRTNGLRSLLTILGIGVAISLIVLLIGLGYGLQNLTIGSIVQSKTLLSMDIQPASADTPPLTIEKIEEMKQLPGVKDITPVITTSGELRVNDKLAALAVTAAYPNFLEMEGITVEKGQMYTEGAKEIVISPQILDLLDISDEAILGATTTLTYTDPNNENATKRVDNVTIVGVDDAEATATLYVPYSLLATEGEPTLSLVKAVATDRAGLVTARDAIQQKGYLVETLLETLDQARSVFRWVTVGLGVFGTIALVVAAIGMFNTLTISLLERTREIGIMKAIGVTDRAIRKLFLTEAGLLGFLGGLAGIGIGLLFDNVLGLILNQTALRFGGIQVNLFQYPNGFLILMVLFPMILAIFTGLYPAIRASRLNPLKALRYE